MFALFKSLLNGIKALKYALINLQLHQAHLI